MKTFLKILLVMFLGVIGIFFVILKTVNVDKFRPKVEQLISKNLKKDVRFEAFSIDISLTKGAHLEVGGMKIFEPGSDVILAALENLELNFDIKSFIFGRHINFSDVYIDSPYVFVKIEQDDSDKVILDPTIKEKQTKEEKETLLSKTNKQQDEESISHEEEVILQDVGEKFDARKKQKASKFFISSLKIENGQLRVMDEVQNLDIPISQIQVDLKNISLLEFFSFECDASLFSETKNLHVKGRVLVSEKMDQVRLDDMVFETRLSEITMSDLKTGFPLLEEKGLESSLRGLFLYTIDQMVLDQNGALVFSSEGTFENGQVKLKQWEDMLTDIQLDFSASDVDLVVEKFQINMGDGLVFARGRLDDYENKALLSLDMSLKNVNLRPFNKFHQEDFQVDGILNTKLSVKSKLTDMDKMWENVKGSADIDLENGKLLHLNVLRLILKQISFVKIFGGDDFFEVIEKNLSSQDKKNLIRDETIFKPIHFSSAISNGIIPTEPFLLETEEFEIRSHVGWQLPNIILFEEASIVLSKEWSQQIVKALPQLGTLIHNNQLVIPLEVYKGPLSDFKPKPNLGESFIKDVFKSLAIDGFKQLFQAESPKTSESLQGNIEQKDAVDPAILIENLWNNIFD